MALEILPFVPSRTLLSRSFADPTYRQLTSHFFLAAVLQLPPPPETCSPSTRPPPETHPSDDVRVDRPPLAVQLDAHFRPKNAFGLPASGYTQEEAVARSALGDPVDGGRRDGPAAGTVECELFVATAVASRDPRLSLLLTTVLGTTLYLHPPHLLTSAPFASHPSPPPTVPCTLARFVSFALAFFSLQCLPLPYPFPLYPLPLLSPFYPFLPLLPSRPRTNDATSLSIPCSGVKQI